MIFLYLAMAAAAPRAVVPNVARDDDYLPTLTADTTETYSYSPVVNDGANNPYIARTTLPENLFFIIIGSILLVVFVSSLSYWLIAKAISVHKAKHHSEKYFYNSPFHLDNSNSTTNSSMSSILEKRSSMSNLSQLTLNQPLNKPLGRPYLNAKLDNNRGSMFFSPTTDLIINNQANQSTSEIDEFHSSSISLLDFSPELTDKLLPDNNSKPKLKRPPSQYLQDLLDD